MLVENMDNKLKELQFMEEQKKHDEAAAAKEKKLRTGFRN